MKRSSDSGPTRCLGLGPKWHVLATLCLVLASLGITPALAQVVGALPTRLLPNPPGVADFPVNLSFDRHGIAYAPFGSVLYAFDGVSWRPLEGTAKHLITHVVGDPERDRLYVCGYESVGYLEAGAGNHLTYTDIRPSLPEALSKEYIFLDPQYLPREGLFWKNLHYLFRWKEGEPVRAWVPGKADDLNQILTTMFVHRGRIWVTSNTYGIFELQGDELVQVPGGDIFTDARTVVRASTLPDGRLLFTTERSGLYLYDGVAFTPLPLPQLAQQESQAFHVVGAGWNRAVLIDSRLNVHLINLQGKVLQTIEGFVESTLFNQTRPEIDPSGQLWLNARHGFIIVDLDSPVTLLDKRHGLPPDLGRIALSGKSLWVGSSAGVLGAKLTDLEAGIPFKRYYEPRVLGSVPIREVQGGVLAMGNFRGFEKGPLGESQLHYKPRDAEEFHFIGFSNGTAINDSRTRPSVFYGVAPDRVDRFTLSPDGQTTSAEPNALGVGVGGVEVLESRDGTIWIEVGPSRVQRWIPEGPEGKGHIVEYTTAHGLPEEWINALYFGDEVVFASKVGIYQFDEKDGRFRPHPLFQELPGDISREFVEFQTDLAGNLWVSSMRGNGVLRRQSNGRYTWDLLNMRSLGMPRVGQFVFDTEGIAWLLTPDKIIRYNDRAKVDTKKDFSTLIREITVLGSGQVLARGLPRIEGQLQVRYQDKALHLAVSATAYEAHERNEFQYWLEGHESAWGEWTAQPFVDYTDLGAGDYTFHVRSRNIYGHMGSEAQLRITVQTPWYLRWYSILGALVGSALGVGGFSSWRSRKLKLRNLELEAMVRERTEQIARQNEEMAETNEELAQANQELIRTNEQVQDNNRRLEEMDREKNEFIGIASHDLRNPIGAIQQAVELIETAEPPLDPNHLEIVGLIAESANTSMTILTNLLDINRIEQGRLVTEIKALDAGKIVIAAVDHYRERAKDKQIELIVELADCGRLLGDPNLVQQVLENYVSNAVKYSPPAKRVWVRCRQDGAMVRLEVQDEGPGIKPEERVKLFRKFSRLSARPTAGEQSVGLGLAIVKRMVEAMHGEVGCESEWGKGAVFYLKLPRGG